MDKPRTQVKCHLHGRKRDTQPITMLSVLSTVELQLAVHPKKPLSNKRNWKSSQTCVINVDHDFDPIPALCADPKYPRHLRRHVFLHLGSLRVGRFNRSCGSLASEPGWLESPRNKRGT